MDTFNPCAPCVSCTFFTQKEDVAIVAEDEVIYRLCVPEFAPSHFYVMLCYRGEQALSDLGENEAFAHMLYERLVAGSVTPCTLGDVIQDAAFDRGRNLP